jgi:hypothetical protein
MYIDLDALYSRSVLNDAKNLLHEQYSEFIKRIVPDPKDSDFETIQFVDAQLELIIEDGRIDVQLDRIPKFLEDQYLISNVIEYNKFAASLNQLDLNKPPKTLASKNNIERCELFINAKLIENAIISIFHLNKLSEFQFYTLADRYLGIATRIRLNRDLLGIFRTYDFLIFTERYKIEKKDIATLKDILDIVDKEDYCFADLPVVLDDLEDLTLKPFVEAETVSSFEKLYRIKVPKRPIFYRIPFLAWNQRDRTKFYVSEENITELIF